MKTLFLVLGFVVLTVIISPFKATAEIYPTGWKFPFCGDWQISCGYGCSSYHQGNDFYAIDWNLPGWDDYGELVVAPASGTVKFAGWRGGYGNTVEVDVGGSWFYRLAHLKVIDVTSGMRVTQGQILGECGNTGIGTGPHIHFAIYYPAKWNGSIIQQIGSNSWGHGMSVPQNGLSGQWSLIEWAYYPSYQKCYSY